MYSYPILGQVNILSAGQKTFTTIICKYPKCVLIAVVYVVSMRKVKARAKLLLKECISSGKAYFDNNCG